MFSYMLYWVCQSFVDDFSTSVLCASLQTTVCRGAWSILNAAGAYSRIQHKFTHVVEQQQHHYSYEMGAKNRVYEKKEKNK